MDEDFIPVKKSQISLFKNFPLFYFSKENEPLLYKKEGELLKEARIKDKQFPDLFIRTSDRENASHALYKTMNAHLEETVFSHGLVPIRQALHALVQEALEGPLNVSGKMLPETIDILFQGYSQNKILVESLAKLSSTSDKLVEHTVNILSLTMQFCTFHHFTQAKAKVLGVSAILHDIGCIQLPPELHNTKTQLSDTQFKEFQTHTTKGYHTIIASGCFTPEIATVALAHHERRDGSGYPNGRTDIPEDAQLIGLINSYEPLAYRGTSRHEDPQKPFDSLQILKNEVIEGKFSRQLFVNFCSCLI
ncbi:MAG: HD domain-containing protein [Desulfobacterales bacterium]|nr:HD domain-containing protein [Desulfobacterales bacterium]